MAMLTGDQYRASIRVARGAAYLAGERVDDVTADRLPAVSLDWIARTYDQHHSDRPRARNQTLHVAAQQCGTSRNRWNYLSPRTSQRPPPPAAWRC